MALNKEQLKQGIKSILMDMITREEDSFEEFAERMADKIDEFVKTADINYSTGLIAPSGGGAVTGTFEGNLT